MHRCGNGIEWRRPARVLHFCRLATRRQRKPNALSE